MTPAERLRQHQRSLTKAQRELDRERTKLEQSEKKLIIDIKKSAKAGQMVRLLSRSAIVTRSMHWQHLPPRSNLATPRLPDVGFPIVCSGYLPGIDGNRMPVK